MPTLTNFADQCELVNLGIAPAGKGPYAFRQSGNAPGDMTLQQENYFLRKDGVWVLNLVVFTLPEKEIGEHYLFRDIPELFSVIETLSAKPLVVEDKLPANNSRSEMLATLQSTASNLISRIRDAK
ncbi:MAG: hypothetical protein WCO86_20405, partial [Planctomycetota bacterium]